MFLSAVLATSTWEDIESIRQLVLPSAARGRNQISDIGGGRALSAFSFQRSACSLIAFVFGYFARQNFFAKRKEVIDKDSIHLAAEAGMPSFEVIGEGGLRADDPNTGIGIWLRLMKEAAHDSR